jgi:hypothetical protein
MQVNYLHQVHSGEISFSHCQSHRQVNIHTHQIINVLWFLWHTKLLDASTTLQK